MKNFLSLISPLYWPAWLGLGILWLITRLPYRWQIQIGKVLGKILYHIPSKLKHITQVNVKLCFPNLNLNQQTTLIKKNFISLGIGIIETAMAWWLPDSKLQHLFHFSGSEHLEHAFKKGKGIILLSPHFTCLEIIGRAVGAKYAFGTLYQPHKKFFIAFIHKHFRQKHYLNYISHHNIRELLRAFKKNTAIWFAYDIDAGKTHNVFAPFFNISASSLTSVSRLVHMSDTDVIPVYFYRRDDNSGYEIVLKPALDHFPSDDLVEDATRLNALLEKSIREKPEQYVWQYKRFKTRPEGEERFY